MNKRRSVIFGFLIAAASFTTIASGALADDGDCEFNERGNGVVMEKDREPLENGHWAAG